MALTLLQQPEGYILNDPFYITATISNSAGDALFTRIAHGLTDGQVIYSKGVIENYNGFWIVETITSDTFFIRPYTGGDNVEFIQATSIEYVTSIHTHGWSCVHLPIVYKLSSNLWPTNGVDTVRSVSSFTNDYGYVNLNLSGSLGTFNELQFVQVSNTGDENLDGIYQIFDKYSTSDITINLAYASTLALNSCNVQLYYSNYAALIRVYGGLDSVHQWQAEKPYELLTTLSLIPDENGEVNFSINEILKSQINVTNNTLLGTLPINLDAFTGFYIEYAESYDTSNGYSIATFESSFTSDKSNFQGFAANAVLPFKNIYSGFISDYVPRISADVSLQKWLTNFDQPTVFGSSEQITEPYFDMSFINDTENAQLFLLKQYYTGGILQTSTEDNLGTLDQGVIRIMIEADCNYETLDLTLKRTVSKLNVLEVKTLKLNCNCSNYDIRLTWLNHLGGFDYFAFNTKKQYNVDITDSGITRKDIFSSWPNSYGEFADTITRQSFRKSNNSLVLVSPYVTLDELNAISFIKSSPLVQIINSRFDRRTVIVDTDSFVKFTEGDKLYSIQFTVTYTDDIPSQRI